MMTGGLCASIQRRLEFGSVAENSLQGNRAALEVLVWRFWRVSFHDNTTDAMLGED